MLPAEDCLRKAVCHLPANQSQILRTPDDVSWQKNADQEDFAGDLGRSCRTLHSDELPCHVGSTFKSRASSTKHMNLARCVIPSCDAWHLCQSRRDGTSLGWRNLKCPQSPKQTMDIADC